ncbi:hypothetical protein OE88DRAFT_1662773 [Heliocybe sulcata]|uniref:SHSP domain-containing protein n=1 Tax=Heliocybe sulcata TaxID=5364 RepID=A0A5C3MVX7_9AGAM|nr:hypothetical protein OE88DRAFT_1662773 [Heliocybe sulcata]
MAYNYAYGDHGPYATTPTTPTTYAASPWEEQFEDEQTAGTPVDQPGLLAPQQHAVYQPPQTVQLEESVPVVPSQPRYSGYSADNARAVYDTASVASDDARTRLGVDTTRSRTILPVRTSPQRAHTQASHPYRRASHAQGKAAASGSATKTHARRLTDDLKSLAVGVTPGSTTTVSCPALGRKPNTAPSGSGGTPGYRAASSPLASTVTSAEDNQPQPQSDATPLKRYNIRTDVHFNAETNTMTAMFEIPGVKKTDIKIMLSRCPYSKAKQVTVRGIAKSVLPDDAAAAGFFTTRERHHGEFKRTLVVPSDAEANAIQAEFQDGILILRVPGGEPAEPFDPESIQVI